MSSISNFSPARAQSYLLHLPIFTRVILVAIVALWFLGLQSVWNVQRWGSLIPSETGIFTLYRINTYPLIHTGFIHMILNLVAIVPMIERFEVENGTLLTVALFYGPFSTVPAILYILVDYGILGKDTPIMGASGWFFILFAIEAVKSSRTQPAFQVGPYKIPTWTTPIIASLFVSILITGTSMLGHICALATGYSYAFGYLSLLNPSDKILRWIENKAMQFGRIPHYVSVDQKAFGRGGVLPSASIEDPISMNLGGNVHRLRV